MTAETMSPIQKSQSQNNSWDQQQFEPVDSSQIKSIQTIDGSWHGVSNCEFKLAGIGNSPVPGVYPTLKYTNEYGQTAYTPLKLVLSYSISPLSSQQKAQFQSQSNR